MTTLTLDAFDQSIERLIRKLQPFVEALGNEALTLDDVKSAAAAIRVVELGGTPVPATSNDGFRVVTTQEPTATAVYLIERCCALPHEYWPPTLDPRDATWFVRREDAKRAALRMFGTSPNNWRVVEHLFFDDGSIRIVTAQAPPSASDVGCPECLPWELCITCKGNQEAEFAASTGEGHQEGRCSRCDQPDPDGMQLICTDCMASARCAPDRDEFHAQRIDTLKVEIKTYRSILAHVLTAVDGVLAQEQARRETLGDVPIPLALSIRALREVVTASAIKRQ